MSHRWSRQCAEGLCGCEKGIALLSVVIVLSTLLLLGILFTVTVDLDLKASRYYRDAGAAEPFALEGLQRALAELQYDMWGVKEPKAFKLADSSQRLADAAYRVVRASGMEPTTKPRSRWRQTVEQIGPHNVLTDYRWVERAGSDPMVDFTHSGATYHDEFLPEGTDNSDVWEWGLHVNRGDVYFAGVPPRSFKNDEKILGIFGANFGTCHPEKSVLSVRQCLT